MVSEEGVSHFLADEAFTFAEANDSFKTLGIQID
jgi:hypothetical protein